MIILTTMVQNNRTKWLILLVGIITLVNLAAVATLVINIRKYHKAPHLETPAFESQGDDTLLKAPGPAFLIKELGFDDEQQLLFEQSRRQFRNQAQPLFAEIRKLDSEIAVEIVRESPDNQKLEAISHQIGELHAQIKSLTINHLREIKNIATPDQQEKLGMFFRDLLSRGSGPMGKGMQNRHRHRGGSK